MWRALWIFVGGGLGAWPGGELSVYSPRDRDRHLPHEAMLLRVFIGKRHPDVEDNVTIYPNSTILGGETVIGANSTIGANVFLTHSVPPNSLVVYEEKQLTIRDKTARKKAGDSDYSI